MTLISVPFSDFAPGQLPPSLSPLHSHSVKVVVPGAARPEREQVRGRLRREHCLSVHNTRVFVHGDPVGNIPQSTEGRGIDLDRATVQVLDEWRTTQQE